MIQEPGFVVAWDSPDSCSAWKPNGAEVFTGGSYVERDLFIATMRGAVKANGKLLTSGADFGWRAVLAPPCRGALRRTAFVPR